MLKDEFMRLQSAGSKINKRVLLDAAIEIIGDPTVLVTQNEIEQYVRRELCGIIKLRFIDEFCECFRIRTRTRTGKKYLSPVEIAKNNNYLGHHLDILKQAHDNRLDPSTVENYDETNMVLHMDSCRILDFKVRSV